jgi:putative transposase
MGTAVFEIRFHGRSQALFYNTAHPHQGLGSRMPMAAWRESISGKFIDKGVDMTLRLDNAGALPTCPQPQQRCAA